MTDIYSDTRIFIYVDIDENGVIVDGESGRRIIPSKQYHHYFITENELALDLESFSTEYKVINGELVRKEA